MNLLRKTLITAALPYANGALHFGHMAGAYLPADIFARYCRLKGRDTLFICGSDEHGVAITMSAELAGRTPQEQVDHFHLVNQDLFKKLNIKFDHYSRTTWPGHKKFTIQFFEDLMANGFIEAKETFQLYSEEEKKFLADRYVIGSCPRCGFLEARGDECQKCGASYEAEELKNPRSKKSGSTLILKKTTNWFLLLDKLRDKVEKWLEEKPWKPNVLNFIKGYLKETHPRAITRDTSWGIPVPLKEAEGKVFYVWFDAPIGYISATADWAERVGTPERWKDYWLDPKTHYVQFIGKDNIPFHAVIFPAMELGQNIPYKMVDDLPANEFYNLEGRQFSKSDGWTIDLADFLTRYSADQIRYTIAANAPENADSEFTWKDFQSRCNSDLLGKLGNFVNRVLVFTFNHFEGRMPALTPHEEDESFLAALKTKVGEIENHFEHYQLRKAASTLMELAHLANCYFDSQKPWMQIKQDKERAATIIACSLKAIEALSRIASPIIPDTAAQINLFLNLPLEEGKTLNKPHILFTKIEDSQMEEEIKKMQATPSVVVQAPIEPLKALIGIEDFDKVDLRVGLVLHAEKVPKSKKLLRLEIDIGLEKRQVLSGIGLQVTPEELIGKKVVIVANLKPATMMGLESQGMLLSIVGGPELKVLPADLSPGSVVV
ncbi:MAG: methionine--tRNA ligase [Chlamydiota bacterium]